LFLDIDGTLLEIASTPAAVIVPVGLKELLERLYGLAHGALALVSGRSLAQLDQLMAPLSSHGGSAWPGTPQQRWVTAS